MQASPAPAADSSRSLGRLLLTFAVVILLLESGGLLIWAERLQIGPLRRVALPVAALLHESLQPIGLERLRASALAGIDRLQQGDATAQADAGPTPGNARASSGVIEEGAPQPQTPPAAQPAPQASAPQQVAHTPPPDLDAASLAGLALPTEAALGLPPLPPPAPDQPRVVALAGDSMMAVGLSGNLLGGMAGHKELNVVRAFRSGTGLSRPEVFDWMAAYPKMIGAQKPDVIIVAIGANDGQGFVENRKVMAFGTDEWVKVYAARVTQFLDLLTRDGAQVVWIGLPPMRSAKFTGTVDVVNRITYRVVRGNPRAFWWNPARSLGDAAGHYREYGPGNGKRTIRLRGDDGIHMSDEGAKLLAQPLLDWLLPAAPAASAPAASAPAAQPVGAGPS